MRCVGIHVCLRWIRSASSRLWCVELLIARSVERDESSRDYRSNPKCLGQRTCDIISDQSRRATIHKGVTSHVERPFTGERLQRRHTGIIASTVIAPRMPSSRDAGGDHKLPPVRITRLQSYDQPPFSKFMWLGKEERKLDEMDRLKCNLCLSPVNTFAPIVVLQKMHNQKDLLDIGGWPCQLPRRWKWDRLLCHFCSTVKASSNTWFDRSALSLSDQTLKDNSIFCCFSCSPSFWAVCRSISSCCLILTDSKILDN
jgi:hypothetical protein